MHRNMRGSGRDDFLRFWDPFPGFWGTSRGRTPLSNFFGGRDPFDDPFISPHPLRDIMGPSIFKGSLFGSYSDTFGDSASFGLPEHQPLRRHRVSIPIIEGTTNEQHEGEGENRVSIPIIQGITNEQHEGEAENRVSIPIIEGTTNEQHEGEKGIFKSRGESNVVLTEQSDACAGDPRQYQNELNSVSGGLPQASKYTFRSSTVTHGGINGAYYTSTTTRKTGADGVVMVEECKEADTSSRRATHRISRGIHDKGHSFSRRLHSDGNVDMLQTLHNLNEDELPGFEEAWKGNAGETLMEWNPGTSTMVYDNKGGGRSSRIIEVEVLPSAAEEIEVSRKTGSEARH